MIYAKEKNMELILPKLRRCDLSCCGLYQLIVQNTYTKQVWMYKVKDYEPDNKLRHYIQFEFLDEMAYGTYQYYLLPEGEWATWEVNSDDVRKTVTMIENSAMQNDGSYLVANGKLLVTNSYEAALLDCDLSIFERDGVAVSTTLQLDDESCEGDIYSYLSILQTGLIKYEPFEFLDGAVQEFADQRIYKEFTDR